jgi:hypothetical protein
MITRDHCGAFAGRTRPPAASAATMRGKSDGAVDR